MELQTQLQERQNDSENTNYIKFKKGHDCKVLRFEAERTRTDDVSYPSNPKPTLQYKFYASEMTDKKENKWTKVREWTVAPTWAKSVIALLLKGFLIQEVTRTGSGINDTSYSVTPCGVNADDLVGVTPNFFCFLMILFSIYEMSG